MSSVIAFGHTRFVLCNTFLPFPSIDTFSILATVPQSLQYSHLCMHKVQTQKLIRRAQELGNEATINNTGNRCWKMSNGHIKDSYDRRLSFALKYGEDSQFPENS